MQIVAVVVQPIYKKTEPVEFEHRGLS